MVLFSMVSLECVRTLARLSLCLNLGLTLELFALFRYHLSLGFRGYPVFLSFLPPRRPAVGKLALAIAAVVLLACGGEAFARDSAAKAGMSSVPLVALPLEAQQTEQRIREGGPFAFAKDGGVFGNRERLLPANARGYYREYTVKTPGARDRGARRIVCGGRQPTLPEACYYTNDHYASFARIVQ
jgi:ribonuclease T1